MPDPITFLTVFASVFAVSFMKGAFGGGFAIVGIPLLALLMDSIEAGALLASLFVLMDLFAFRYWSPSTWSKPDLMPLIPSLLLGIALGTWLLSVLDDRAIAILIGAVTFTFAARWYLGGGALVRRKRSLVGASLAGTVSGITTMVAHAGGPPLAIYLISLGLPKNIYAGTTSLFFTVGNVIKLFPWLWLGFAADTAWLLVLLALPAVPLGVLTGWKLHQRLDQRTIYSLLYALLVLVSVQLLWDGISGYLTV